MISEKMTQALNKQVQEELYSAYLYLAMSAYYQLKGMKGFGTWLQIQHQEESEHAMKIYHYLLHQGAHVDLLPIAKPTFQEGKSQAIFEQVLQHEKHITGCIHQLVEQALQEKDYATHTFLQWFVMEQVEEEANALDIVDKLKMIQEQPGGLFMLDKVLGERGAKED